MPPGLIYPPSSRGKISFSRRIAERVPLTGLYKSFFNQRPVRLGRRRPQELLRDISTPPCVPLQPWPPLVSTAGLSVLVSVSGNLKGMSRHPNISSTKNKLMTQNKKRSKLPVLLSSGDPMTGYVILNECKMSCQRSDRVWIIN